MHQLPGIFNTYSVPVNNILYQLSTDFQLTDQFEKNIANITPEGNQCGGSFYHIS